MHAEARVKDKRGKTVGFIVDGRFMYAVAVVQQIAYMDNLQVQTNGKLVCTRGALPIMTMQRVHMQNSVIAHMVNAGIVPRDVQIDIRDWYVHGTARILCIEGARQVGKTTEILKFAVETYSQLIYVNLADEGQYAAFVQYVVDTVEDVQVGMQKYCSHVSQQPFFNNHDTVLILDEIQAHKAHVYSHLRKIHALNCHVIITGSYLGAALQQDVFQPAGDLQRLKMTPLSFREFCRALHLENCLDTANANARQKHKKLYDAFEVYKQIGGYPAVVSEYCRSSDLTRCFDVINGLVTTFIQESGIYFVQEETAEAQLILRRTFEYALRAMLFEKKGNSAVFDDLTRNIAEGDRRISAKKMRTALSWLYTSGIISDCDKMVELNPQQVLNGQRMYFTDTGVLSYVSTLINVPQDNIRGLQAETFAYNELARKQFKLWREKQFCKPTPCFGTYKGDTYEVDFVIVSKKDGTRYGIEIKAGNAAHASLDKVLQDKRIDIGIVACKTVGGGTASCKKVPIYFVAERFPDYADT